MIRRGRIRDALSAVAVHCFPAHARRTFLLSVRHSRLLKDAFEFKQMFSFLFRVYLHYDGTSDAFCLLVFPNQSEDSFR